MFLLLCGPERPWAALNVKLGSCFWFGVFSTLSGTEKRFHNMRLGQRSLETNGWPPKLDDKGFWRGNDWEPMERFGVELKIVCGGERSCLVPLFRFERKKGSTNWALNCCTLEIDNFEKKQQKKKERPHSKRSPCENRAGKIFASKYRQKHVCGGIALLAMCSDQTRSGRESVQVCCGRAAEIGDHYRKRGSASYIVCDVLSVRERDTEREREKDESDVTIVALKLAVNLHFPLPKIRTIGDELRGRRKSSQKLAKRRTLVSFPTPSLPPETNENRNPGFSVPLLELETFSRRECTSSQPFSMSSVTWAIHDRSLVGSSSNEGITALSYCVRVCFTSKSEVENFPALSWTAGRSARRRWAVSPRQDRVSTCRQAASLNESRSVSDRSASLVAAGDACSAERRAGCRLVGKNRTAVLVASPRLGRLSLAAWPLVRRTGWARHQQVFDSASNRDKCLPQLGGTFPLLVCLCRSTVCCLPSQGIRWTCPPHPSQCTPLDRTPCSTRCAARRSAARKSTRSSFFFFFLKPALRLRSRPPPPKRTFFVSQASANFCDGPLHFPLPKVRTFRFSLHTSSPFTERSPWWPWNSQWVHTVCVWVHTFHCQKIFRPQALFPLFQMARAVRRVIENPRQMIKSCPVLFCSSHRKNEWN